MKLRDSEYPNGSSIQRLRNFIFDRFRKTENKAGEERPTSKGDAGETVDKKDAGKPI